MYNFIICEDNFNTGMIIKNYIAEYSTKKGLEFSIHLFCNNFKQIIDFTRANLGHVNVFFLDIVLNEEDATGLSLAKKIRKIDIMAYFIFITSHPELSLKVFQYKLKALDCIFKQEENIQKRIHECIDTIAFEAPKISNWNSNMQITLKSVGDVYTVNLNEIMYFETRPGSRLLYCILIDHTCIEFHSTLKEVKKKLDSRFFQCHRSFIVNTKYIKKFCRNKQNYSVTMSDGKVCDVSRPKWKELLTHVRI